jgi:amidophosphoribosyltransferase
MVKAAGAREVHLRISCPPTISPCFYGVDTPSKSELIAATHSLEEIRKYVGADSLAYLSLEGLRSAVASQQNDYCTSCYTGVYPVAFPRNEQAYLQLALKAVE